MIRVQKYTNGKNVVFNWKAPLHEVEVTIEIPKLDKNNYKVFGDWGLNYDVSLNAENPIIVRYKDLKTGQCELATLDQNHLNISSPIISEIREVYPYFYSVLDEKRDFRFDLYADDTGEVKKVDIFRIEDDVKLFTQKLCA
jgi:hypothetical protein